jgi:uncharacterized membrane protein
MATKCEQLIAQVGNPVQCDICHKKRAFDRDWMMTGKKLVVCPKCQPSALKSGELLVSI